MQNVQAVNHALIILLALHTMCLRRLNSPTVSLYKPQIDVCEIRIFDSDSFFGSLGKTGGTSGTTDVECWQPCRDNTDCCFDQECIATASSCEVPNFQGSSHFFCGYGKLVISMYSRNASFKSNKLTVVFMQSIFLFWKIFAMPLLDAPHHVLQ